MPFHRATPDAPRRPVVILASAYRGETEAFVKEVHRYDGWWAEAMTYGGSRYRGYIREGSTKDPRLRLEPGLSANSVDLPVGDIDAVDIRYAPHRWVVPWELRPAR